jgi:archaellum biogenesis ATPase FlaH
VGLIRLSDYRPSPKQWLIDGLLHPHLTLLSGQPKAGKTLFAAHIVRSLLTGQELCGRPVDGREHKVLWLGVDGDWRADIHRLLKAPSSVLVPDQTDNFRHWDEERWALMAREAASDGVTLLVVDHLLGIANGANLNDAHEVTPIFERLANFCDAGVAVLLLTHAGNNVSQKGRAASSFAIRANPRQLLQLEKLSRSQRRNLHVEGNDVTEAKLTISQLTPEVCRLGAAQEEKQEGAASVEEKERRAHQDLVTLAWMVNDLPPEDRVSKRAAARAIKRDVAGRAAGSGPWVTRTVDSLRTLLGQLEKKELLALGNDGLLTAGSKLQPR